MLLDTGLIVLLFMMSFLAITSIPGLRVFALIVADIVVVVTVVMLVGLFVSGNLQFEHVLQGAMSGFTGNNLIPIIGSMSIMAACATICGQDGLNSEEIRLIMGTGVISNAVIARFSMHIPLTNDSGNLNSSFSTGFFVLFSISIIIISLLLVWFGTEKAKAWRAGRRVQTGDIIEEGALALPNGGGAYPVKLFAGILIIILVAAAIYNSDVIKKSWDPWTETPASAGTEPRTVSTPLPLNPTVEKMAKARAERRQRNIEAISGIDTKSTKCDCLKAGSDRMVSTGSGNSYREVTCANGKKYSSSEVIGVPRCP